MVWASGTDSSNQSLSFSLTFHCMFFTHRISRHAELDGRWGGVTSTDDAGGRRYVAADGSVCDLATGP